MTNASSATKQIEDSLGYLTTTAEQAQEGVILTSLNGITRFANASAAKIHGYSTPNELLGKSISILHTPQQNKEDLPELIEQVKTNCQVNCPLQRLRKDGSVFPSQTKVHLLTDTENRQVGFVFLIVDMTEYRQLQRRLDEYKAQLAAVSEKLAQNGDYTDEIDFEIDEDPCQTSIHLEEVLGQNGPLDVEQLSALAEQARRLSQDQTT